MIVLDTSVLIDSLTGPARSAAALRSAIEQGERTLLPSLVLYEWLRGPRLAEELAAQEALFPSESAFPFGSAEALVSARLYRSVRRPRGRELDLAIAACAIVKESLLWTLNTDDFKDLPGLQLWTPKPAI
jgi:predicted nucleic acid-binding protein